MGLTSDQFWRMTYREFGLYIEAWNHRTKDDMRRRAWEAAAIINHSWGARVTPAGLLGEEVIQLEAADFSNPEEFKAHMRKRSGDDG